MRPAAETLSGVQSPSSEDHERPTPPIPYPAATRKRGRRGDWIQTASGVAFWPMDPLASEVRLGDIAAALSKMARFGGHTQGDLAYTVAQHSVLVALSLPHHLRAQGLMHDATEAYCIDVPRPIKRHLINYDVIEARLAAVIGDRFSLELCDLPPEVVLADERALMTEKRDLLLPPPLAWGDAQGVPCEPWKARIAPWSPADARKAFLGLAWKLGIK